MGLSCTIILVIVSLRAAEANFGCLRFVSLCSPPGGKSVYLKFETKIKALYSHYEGIVPFYIKTTERKDKK